MNNEGGPITADKQDNIIGSAIIKQVNRILLGNLSKRVPHLVKCQVKCNYRLVLIHPYKENKGLKMYANCITDLF
jgi:hypothetical protein